LSRRVVMFTPGHSEPGGAQRRSQLLAQGLAAAGWDVRAVTRSGSTNRPRLIRSERLTVLEVPGFGNPLVGGILFLLAALPMGLVWGFRASALISLQLMSTSTVAAMCGVLLRRPFLAMATTTAGLSELDYLRSTRTWWLRRRLLGNAAYVLAQTDDARPALRELVSPERIAVLPNPVELPSEVPALNGRPRALFAGRLSAEKNLFVLLDAWREVVAQIPDAQLTLLGEGGHFRSVERELRERVESDPVLAKTVRMHGWTRDVPSVLRNNDVFVLPSVTEGMSNALLEACAHGRIVIATDIPSNESVLGSEYPLLVPAQDHTRFREALIAAFDSDAEERKRARAQVVERSRSFSTASVVSRLERLLDAASSPRN
jgi:glycosyltransferase involved in cell wall biosynthesis